MAATPTSEGPYRSLPLTPASWEPRTSSAPPSRQLTQPRDGGDLSHKVSVLQQALAVRPPLPSAAPG